MQDFDLLAEIEHSDEDEEILGEIEQRKKAARRSFSSVINKKKLSKFELDEVME